MQKPIRILLVEDNQKDVELIAAALSDSKIRNAITVARDGTEATALLSESTLPLPDLILLDINMPRMNGKEVLGFIKRNDRLRRIPVIMLTTSANVTDVKEAYSNLANCYISKPSDPMKFREVVRTLEHFWTSTVQLPSQ
jgi:two-component system, chemotaxis family, response regulator Rcp1